MRAVDDTTVFIGDDNYTALMKIIASFDEKTKLTNMQISNIPLSKPIVITATLQLYQYVFEQFDQRPAHLKFKCVCENFDTFDLHYGEKAFSFNDLYKNGILSKQTVLTIKIKPILYTIVECPHCHKQILIAYRVSEPNNNRFVCEIAGVFILL